MILILTGPSGSGKTTIRNILTGKFGIPRLISATTRKRRPDEVDGVDYMFVNRDEFENMKKRDQLLEWVLYQGNYYGLLKGQGMSGVSVLEANGALRLKELFPSDVKIVYFDIPPEVRRNRMLSRGDSPDEADRRLKADDQWHDMPMIRDKSDLIIQDTEVDVIISKILRLVNCQQECYRDSLSGNAVRRSVPVAIPDKKEIVHILEQLGIMMELTDESPFKARAYYNAARTIELINEDLKALVEEDRLKDIKGIGKALDEKIKELVNTGRLKYYEELRTTIPDGLFELLKVPGLGPKKVRTLYNELGISTLGELEYSCIENRLVELPGFGQKTQQKVLEGIQYMRKNSGRFLYPEAAATAEELLHGFGDQDPVDAVNIAGSLRRGLETVKDIDILAAGTDADAIMDRFERLPGVERVVERGPSKLSAMMDNGIRVDLRVVSNEEYPFALHHFTGSKEHNTAIRHRAKALGLKVNEYGIFSEDGDKVVQCKDEAEFFEYLGLMYIPPEIRENNGEIEAAGQRELPELVKQDDIKGIFHVHTNYSDGLASIEEMAKKAMAMGLQYLGISDHSKSAFYAGGLKYDAILRQREEINKLNSHYRNFRVFAGIESDILPDGSLDYPDEVLSGFDFVIASVHSGFNMDKDSMTKRLIKALENTYVTMLGHPTGRLLLAREGYPVDLEKVLDAAAGYRKVIELNANPYRLDLDWRWCRIAKDKGVKISINPDAHSPEGMDDIKYGINAARKGWLEKCNVFNSIPLSDMEKLLVKPSK